MKQEWCRLVKSFSLMVSTRGFCSGAIALPMTDNARHSVADGVWLSRDILRPDDKLPKSNELSRIKWRSRLLLVFLFVLVLSDSAVFRDWYDIVLRPRVKLEMVRVAEVTATLHSVCWRIKTEILKWNNCVRFMSFSSSLEVKTGDNYSLKARCALFCAISCHIQTVHKDIAECMVVRLWASNLPSLS